MSDEIYQREEWIHAYPVHALHQINRERKTDNDH